MQEKNIIQLNLTEKNQMNQKKQQGGNLRVAIWEEKIESSRPSNTPSPQFNFVKRLN
jgi:hypothetical protein